MIRILLVLSLLINVAYAKDAKQSIEEYWRGTGLTFKEFSDRELPSCYDDEAHFRGCVDAIGQMAELLNPGLQLVLNNEVATEDLFRGDKKIDLSKEFLLYSVKPSEIKDPLLLLSKLKSRQLSHDQNIKTLFKNTLESKIDFAAVTQKLLPMVLQGERTNDEAFVAAIAYNAYLNDIHDPHTYIIPSQYMNDQVHEPQIDFYGIGASLEPTSDGNIKVTYLYEGPAKAAGLKYGDVITEVDGVSVQGKSVDQVIPAIKGVKGSTVTLTYKRDQTINKVTIARGRIVKNNVETSIIEDAGKKVGYISFSSFMAEDSDVIEIMTAIADFKSSGVKGIVFDLRDNGGGYLNLAIDITSLFIGAKKEVVGVMNLKSGAWQHYSGYGPLLLDVPMVTLINSGSASASEIMSGALQDQKASWILGRRSFGKGSVQSGSIFKGNRAITYNQTIARFYQPSGRTNQVQGIIPDFDVPSAPGKTEQRIEQREEDLYTNALPPIGEKWVNPRATQIAELDKCRVDASGNDKAAALFDKLIPGAVNLPDYQLLSAEVLIDCLTQ